MSVHVCIKEGTPGEGRMGKELVQCVARTRSGERLMNAQAMGRLVSSLPRGFSNVPSYGYAAVMVDVDFCQVIMDRMDIGPEHRHFGIRGSGVEVALPHAWLLVQLSCADIPSVELLRRSLQMIEGVS